LDIAIRVDGNQEIGAGHVLRCVTLAQKLHEYGIKPTFFVRNISKNLLDFIEQKFDVILLVEIDQDFKPTNAYSNWLGVSQVFDAEEFSLKAKKRNFIGVVVDHYGIGSVWETAVSKLIGNILIFDDLADRKHICNMLVDQSIGRDLKAYSGLVPDCCSLLLGSKYALLRDEFLDKAEYKTKKYDVVINFGGVDKDNYTNHVLDLIAQCAGIGEIFIKVIIGKDYPYKNELTEKVKVKNLKVKLVVNPTHISEEIAECKFSIGAGGVSLLERSAMGVPSILYSVAENQNHICEEYGKRNLGFVIQKGDNGEALKLQAAICKLKKKPILKKLAQLNKKLVDARGTNRVVNYLLANFNLYSFYAPSINDVNFIFDCRYTNVNKSFYVSSIIPTYEKHVIWFQEALKNENCKQFLLKAGNLSVGYFRLDDKIAYYEVSLYVHESYRGRGFGDVMLKHVCDNYNRKKLRAFVHLDNISSLRVFEKSGFSIIERSGELLRLELC